MSIPNFINFENTQYLEEMYQKYLQNPEGVDVNLRLFFTGFDLGYVRAPQKISSGSFITSTSSAGSKSASENSASSIAESFRKYGHLSANLNPLEAAPQLSTNQGINNLADGPDKEKYKSLYCSTVAYEFSHCDNIEIKNWLIQKIENVDRSRQLDSDKKKKILEQITEAEVFEQFIHTKYIGQKRFSVEGAEALLPLLNFVLEGAVENGASHLVLGMAHRGRLNVLSNFLQKPYEKTFVEFDGFGLESKYGSGDVKYHKGWSSKREIAGSDGSKRTIHLSLLHNPSHLEFVNPVVLGDCYAKQRRLNDLKKSRVIPVLIHGDAAFSGQGIVSECLQMSKLPAYDVGGAIHIIIDNQVGFTGTWKSTHFTEYCTDLAKSISAPVIHVNGEDPEACAFVARLAAEYRQTFKQDIFVRLVCYRKYGHNEGDEPSFTQPLMYKIIKQKQSVRAHYEQKLVQNKIIGPDENKQYEKQYRQILQSAQDSAKKLNKDYSSEAFQGNWAGFKFVSATDVFKFSASEPTQLVNIAEKIFVCPDNFTPHPKLKKIMEDRLSLTREGRSIDWGTAELLAFGALLQNGIPVRLTGQDVQRGTFSHRHSVLHDFVNGSTYCGLNTLSRGAVKFDVHNSLLSEEAVLGFEYGLSQDHPQQLVIWEGQFGDFANGAQVIIDQFLASGFTKWQRASGLVMLLPHGQEGQGPEHSSARLERFLQLSADLNWQVCNLTTPAQYYKALLNQVYRKIRIPLIIMSPKSLLRNPLAVSPIDEILKTPFKTVIGDQSFENVPSGQKGKVEKLIICSGKVYYDLIQMRDQVSVSSPAASLIPIVRVEQLYPFDIAAVIKELANFVHLKDLIWVQEEPKNQGAWNFIQSEILEESAFSSYRLKYVGPNASSSPAVGNANAHKQQQSEMLKSALGAS